MLVVRGALKRHALPSRSACQLISPCQIARLVSMAVVQVQLDGSLLEAQNVLGQCPDLVENRLETPRRR